MHIELFSFDNIRPNSFDYQTFGHIFLYTTFVETLIPLANKTYRRDWAQAQALAKLREMRGKPMSNVAIADELGVTDVFIGRMLRAVDPDPVSEKVWNALIEKTGFVPVPPGKAGTTPQTEIVQPVTTPHEEELARMLERVLDQNDALVKRLDTQGALLTALWDAVRGNSAVLGEVRAALAQLNEEQP